MKKITVLLLLAFLISCSSQDESILKGNKEETAELSDENGKNKLVFGEKKGERELDARNVFKLGEPAYFYVKTAEKLDVSKILVVLKKRQQDSWNKITEGPLEVKPDWDQFMNGLPASIFIKAGAGVYKLEVIKDEEVIASGDFIIEKDDQEKQS